MRGLLNVISDPTRVVFDGIEDKYLTDGLGRLRGQASALVFPLSTQEVSGVMRWAYDRRVPVTPRGAGTNLVGSTVPHGGIVLDLSRMNRVLELDESTFTVTVEPGILLQDLQAYVEARGLFYPPDPGEKASSIGGNIATNAGGMRAVKYGVTRDYVRGLEVVLADGEVLALGGKCVKDASGLSLKNLIVGSEGTLAVITKCILKLVPRPETSLSAVVCCKSLSDGIRGVAAVLRGDLGPTAVEFIDRKVVGLGERYAGVRFPRPDAGSYILLTFDGGASSVRSRLEKARRLTLDGGALDFVILDDPAAAADVWKARGALVKAVEATSEQEPVDIVVPISRITDFMAFVSGLEQRSGVQMVSFGHAGDGNIHLCVVRGTRTQEEWEQVHRTVMPRIYAKAYELGGLASGEHGIGLSKRDWFLCHTPAGSLRAMNRIKDALDERRILNDGKSYVIGGGRYAETV